MLLLTDRAEAGRRSLSAWIATLIAPDVNLHSCGQRIE